MQLVAILTTVKPVVVRTTMEVVGAVASVEGIVLTATVQRVLYQVNMTWKVVADVCTLLNRRDNAINYYYASRLPDEAPGQDAGGCNDIHFHPVEPLSGWG